MNCEWVRDSMSAYMDGELSESRKEMIDIHLLDCPECKAEFNRLSMA
jgi:anti-sigma factor RsiW